MSPTQVYKIFKTIFPDFKVTSYRQVKGDVNAIILVDEWGKEYFFRHLSDTFWTFQTINYKPKERS